MNNSHYLTSKPNIIYNSGSNFLFSENQCDACSPVVPASLTTNYFKQNAKYTISPVLKKLCLDKLHFVVYDPWLKSNPIVINLSALILAQYFQEARKLTSLPRSYLNIWSVDVIQKTLKQMVSIGLLRPRNSNHPKLEETNGILATWLHITNSCNLRCEYCYLPHKHSEMTMHTGIDAIKSIYRSALKHKYSKVKIKYAGGEPLIRFSLINRLHRFAKIQADQHHINIDGVILTNGTLLTSSIIRQIKSLGLRLMISLDGVDKLNNRQRIYKDGRSSVDDSIRAIELSLFHDLVPEISITVSGYNIDGLSDLILWVLERGLPFNINFYRENNFSLFNNDLKLNEERIISGMLAMYKIIETNLPKRSLLASLVDRANFSFPHLRTCSVGHSYLVFDCKGNVAKCQMDLENAVSNTNDFDPLTRVRESKKGIQNIELNKKIECKDCFWRYWCAGGCPLMAYRKNGCYNTKSPYCNIYKALYPEVMRLEGRRLLKYTKNIE